MATMPGPNPKPFALRVIQGTDSPKTKAQQPKDPGSMTKVPPAPDWLPNVEAAKEWNRLGAILVRNGLLNETSISAFGHLCALHGKLVALWRFGETPTGFLINQYRSLLSDFGVTPGASAKLSSGLNRSALPAESGNRFARNGKAART